MAEARSSIFATTRWVVVLNAGEAPSAQQADALAQLCQTYWYPLYAYTRRQGASVEDAQDLTQEFFARLLERNYLDRADPNKGKFRWFLLGALKHFLSNQRERARPSSAAGVRFTFLSMRLPLRNAISLNRAPPSPLKDLRTRLGDDTVGAGPRTTARALREGGKRERFESWPASFREAMRKSPMPNGGRVGHERRRAAGRTAPI